MYYFLVYLFTSVIKFVSYGEVVFGNEKNFFFDFGINKNNLRFFTRQRTRHLDAAAIKAEHLWMMTALGSIHSARTCYIPAE